MLARPRRQARLAATWVFAAALSACGGSQPSVPLGAITAPDIDSALIDLLRDASGPALVWHAARYPSPDAAICLALIIGCEGGLGPMHFGSPSETEGSVFRFLERRRGVFLAETTRTSKEDDDRTTYRALAGWMDHGYFLVDTPYLGVPPGEGLPHHRYYSAYSVGNVTATNPDVSMGTAATWSGVMSGLLLLDPDRSDPDAFVSGDATVTVSGRPANSSLFVDVEFSNVRNEATGADIANLRWPDLPLFAGSFGISPVSADESTVSRHPASSGISGRFYGPAHEEVGGVFGRSEVTYADSGVSGVRMEVSGAFGARRD